MKNNSAIKRVYIADPSFQDWQGHHVSYDLSIQEALEKAGLEGLIWANRKVSLEEGPGGAVSFEKVFSRNAWGCGGRLGSKSPAFLRAALDYWELRAVCQKRGLGAGDLILAHMLTPYSLPLWACFAQWLAKRHEAALTLVLRYPLETMAQARFYRHFLAGLNMAAQRGRVCLATDSALLAEEYAPFFSRPLTVLPIPHVSPNVYPAGGQGPLHCVFLGNARAEKGIVEIFQAVSQLNENGQGEKFTFSLQVNDPDDGCREAVSRFAEAVPPNVRLYREALPRKRYEELLAGADVVLAPYWSEIYAARTSGIMLEALAAGKMIVSTRGTWMERELLRFNAAFELAEPRNSREIAAALLTMAAAPHPYIAKAVPAAERARCFHNPDNFVKILLA